MITSLIAFCVISEPLKFVDEGPQDKSFLEFRRNLIGSIKKKNYTWVVNRIAPDITFSFGFDDGLNELKSYWEMEDNGQEMWMQELLEAVQLGGQFKSFEEGVRVFEAPYTWSAWPDELDAFEYVAVLGKEKPVYANADTGSKVVAKLSESAVVSREWEEGFREVEYAPDKFGWMSEADVRSPIDYRARFTKIKGNWMLSIFVAGD